MISKYINNHLVPPEQIFDFTENPPVINHSHNHNHNDNDSPSLSSCIKLHPVSTDTDVKSSILIPISTRALTSPSRSITTSTNASNQSPIHSYEFDILGSITNQSNLTKISSSSSSVAKPDTIKKNISLPKHAINGLILDILHKSGDNSINIQNMNILKNPQKCQQEKEQEQAKQKQPTKSKQRTTTTTTTTKTSIFKSIYEYILGSCLEKSTNSNCESQINELIINDGFTNIACARDSISINSPTSSSYGGNTPIINFKNAERIFGNITNNINNIINIDNGTKISKDVLQSSGGLDNTRIHGSNNHEEMKQDINSFRHVSKLEQASISKDDKENINQSSGDTFVKVPETSINVVYKKPMLTPILTTNGFVVYYSNGTQSYRYFNVKAQRQRSISAINKEIRTRMVNLNPIIQLPYDPVILETIPEENYKCHLKVRL